MKRNLFLGITAVTLAAAVFFAPMNVYAGEAELEHLYEMAIIDALDADADEVEPLVNINPADEKTFWNEDNTRVLMVTFHRFPDSYPEQQMINTSWGDSWVTSVQEFLYWYNQNSESVTDWDLRYKQLLGMPADSRNDTVSLLWVDPSSLSRPAYVQDINAEMTNFFATAPEDAYMEWFNEYSCSSYQQHGYPWTRLGYTYDWADNGTSYGLSEFILEQGSDVIVEKTMSLDTYIDWISQ